MALRNWNAAAAAARTSLALVVGLAALLPRPASAQCASLWERFPSTQLPGIRVLLADDSGGPVFYAGGTFTSAGGAVVNHIARFDENGWTALGSGTNGNVLALFLHDEDGPGPMPRSLFVGGTFTTAGGISASGIARWDGSSWSALGAGLNGGVFALAAFDDDGPGPNPETLHAAGSFMTAAGAPANGIAKWNGLTWSALGTGTDASVKALAVFDADDGGPLLPALYAVGSFTTAGGVAARGIASWDGVSWSPAGSASAGFDWEGANELAVFDQDGAGPGRTALYAAGSFTEVAGTAAVNIARWDGAAWSAVGSGLNYNSVWAGLPAVRSLFVIDDDGAGPNPEALYAGGSFSGLLKRWDGQNWTTLGSGPNPVVIFSYTHFVEALVALDEDGPGPNPPRLHAAGQYQFDEYSGEQPAYMARWDSTTWTWPGRGTDRGVRVFEVFDEDGPGPRSEALYAAGSFYFAGGQIVRRIARWDGSSWSSMGNGVGLDVNPNPVMTAIEVFDADGPGPNLPELHVGGRFGFSFGISKWNGTAWSSLPYGNGVHELSTLAAFDPDGAGPALPSLYAGTDLLRSSPGIARWNGSAWSGLGSGLDGRVWVMTTFDDDGAGPRPEALYVGGEFLHADGFPANRIARWDGFTWETLGSGTDGPIEALAVFDEDGPGPARARLFAGGSFGNAGGQAAVGIARWDGSSWSALDAVGIQGIKTLVVHDEDGAGPKRAVLVAGGTFTSAGGMPTARIAKWDGASWAPLGGGITDSLQGDTVLALMPFDTDGPGPAPGGLFVGGDFQQVEGQPSAHIARWVGCVPTPVVFCAGDATGTLCPCGNSGATGNGCAHSQNPSGAHLTGEGAFSIAADSFTLIGTGMPNSTCLYLQGTGQVNGGQGVAFGDGLRCVAGSIVRLGLKSNVGGNSQYPVAGDSPISVRGACAAGDLRYYQVWYRNAASFCTPATFNLTNGLNLTWSP